MISILSVGPYHILFRVVLQSDIIHLKNRLAILANLFDVSIYLLPFDLCLLRKLLLNIWVQNVNLIKLLGSLSSLYPCIIDNNEC